MYKHRFIQYLRQPPFSLGNVCTFSLKNTIIYNYHSSFRGGVIYAELNQVQMKLFQKSILTTLLEIEKTYFQLAEQDTGNVLIVCDRGSMDPLACEDRPYT